MENELKEGSVINKENKSLLRKGDILLLSDWGDFYDVKVELLSDYGVFVRGLWSTKRKHIANQALDRLIFVRNGKNHRQKITEKEISFSSAKKEHDNLGSGFLKNIINDIKKLFSL